MISAAEISISMMLLIFRVLFNIGAGSTYSSAETRQSNLHEGMPLAVHRTSIDSGWVTKPQACLPSLSRKDRKQEASWVARARE